MCVYFDQQPASNCSQRCSGKNAATGQMPQSQMLLQLFQLLSLKLRCFCSRGKFWLRESQVWDESKASWEFKTSKSCQVSGVTWEEHWSLCTSNFQRKTVVTCVTSLSRHFSLQRGQCITFFLKTFHIWNYITALGSILFLSHIIWRIPS